MAEIIAKALAKLKVQFRDGVDGRKQEDPLLKIIAPVTEHPCQMPTAGANNAPLMRCWKSVALGAAQACFDGG
jgi:hypothetical protein